MIHTVRPLTFVFSLLLSFSFAHSFAQRATSTPQDFFKLGLQFYEREEYEEALASFQKALTIARQNSQTQQITSATKKISDCLYALGQYEAALESYRRTLALQEQAGDQPGVADTIMRIGNCHYGLSDLDEAAVNYRQSLALANQLRLSLIIAESLSGLGLVSFVQQDFTAALEQFYPSLNHYATAGAKNGIIQALQNIGNTNLRLNNFRMAHESFQNARFLLEEAGRIDDAHETLLSIGLAHFAQKNYASALAACQKALEYFEPKNNQTQVATALYRIGLIKFAEGAWPEALRLAERAAAVAAQAENREILWRAQLEIGRAHFSLQQPARAQQAWSEAVITVEKMRAQLRGNDIDAAQERVLPCIALASLFIEQNQTIEAFHYAERAKAQLLWSLLQGNRTRITKTLTPLEIDAEKKLRHEANIIALRLDRARRNNADENLQSRLKEQLQKTRTQLSILLNRLYVRHPQLKIYRGEAAPIKVEEVASFLPDDKRALLEYLVTDNESYLFVFTRAARPAARTSLELNVYKLGFGAAEAAERVLRWRQQIATHAENYQPLARELYDLLLAPAHEQLAGKTALTIVPDGILWALPFAALQPGENNFLITERIINFAGSFSALREMNRLARSRKPATAASVLAIAPAQLNQELLTSLKLNFAQADETTIRALRNIYGSARTEFLSGNEARENNLQTAAMAASVLHIAAPTVINNFRPLYSYNIFAPADAAKLKTGFFPAWKLTQMNWRADLAIFAESSVFPLDRKQGNGLTGMNWASFVAGSPTMIISQWQSVPDVWQEFHERYKLTASASIALQQAMLKLSQNPGTQHPYYWAGFMAMGAAK